MIKSDGRPCRCEIEYILGSSDILGSLMQWRQVRDSLTCAVVPRRRTKDQALSRSRRQTCCRRWTKGLEHQVHQWSSLRHGPRFSTDDAGTLVLNVTLKCSDMICGWCDWCVVRLFG